MFAEFRFAAGLTSVFHFSGRLSASAFAFRGWIAVAVFAATVFGFPFLQYSMITDSGCAGAGDACGAVGLVAALAIKPIFFYGFVAFLVGISVPRARDLGLPAICGLFLPLMVLADSAFGLLAGAGWAAAFALGELRIGPPVFLMFALALMVFLSLAPTDSLRAANHPRLRFLTLAVGAILSIAAIWQNLPTWAPTIYERSKGGAGSMRRTRSSFSPARSFPARIRGAVPEVTEIIQQSYGPRYEREDCASAGSSGVKRAKIDALPDEYVRLVGGRDSRLAPKDQVYSAIGQPLELHHVAPGRDDLIAISHETSKPYPLAPPLLASSGWLRRSNSAMMDDVCARTHRFVTEALIQQRPSTSAN